jgi:hypothetical protein
VKLLRDHGGGHLELRRIESPADVPCYVDALASLGIVARNGGSALQLHGTSSREQRVRRSVAERGLLRSYILYSRGNVIGCIQGNQHQGIYLVDAIRYRPEYANFSPGAVMLYMAIEDLLTHRPVRMINYAFGEPNRMHHKSNIVLQYSSVILFRRVPVNHLLVTAHRAFLSTIRWWKRRRSPQESPLCGETAPASELRGNPSG